MRKISVFHVNTYIKDCSSVWAHDGKFGKYGNFGGQNIVVNENLYNCTEWHICVVMADMNEVVL